MNRMIDSTEARRGKDVLLDAEAMMLYREIKIQITKIQWNNEIYVRVDCVCVKIQMHVCEVMLLSRKIEEVRRVMVMVMAMVMERENKNEMGGMKK